MWQHKIQSFILYRLLAGVKSFDELNRQQNICSDIFRHSNLTDKKVIATPLPLSQLLGSAAYSKLLQFYWVNWIIDPLILFYTEKKMSAATGNFWTQSFFLSHSSDNDKFCFIFVAQKVGLKEFFFLILCH